MLQYKHYLEIKINTKIINRDESSCLRIKSWVSLFMSMYNSIRKKKKGKNGTHRGNSMLERNGKELFIAFTVARG